MNSILAVTSCAVLTALIPLALVPRHETLGPLQDANGDPVSLASGSATVIAGVGLAEATLPKNIAIAIPAGATVKQVFAYWTGEGKTEAEFSETDTIKLGIHSVTGLRVGGPDFFFTFEGSNYTASYRADITSLGLVAAGANSVAIDDMDFGYNLGLGLYAIIQEGTASSVIQLRDGNDNAYANFPAPRKETIPQTFSFPAAAVARTATLNYFAGSVGSTRPNVIEVAVDGVTDPIRFIDPLKSAGGDLFDAYSHTVPVPAGSTSITVKVISEDAHNPPTGMLPASLNWIAGGLSLPTPQQGGGEGCTPGYWKNHTESWPATLSPKDTLGDAFGFSSIPAWDTDLKDRKLISALQGGGGNGLNGATKILMRAATASLLNATASEVNFPLSADMVKLQVLTALSLPVASTTRAQLIELAAALDRANNLGCNK